MAKNNLNANFENLKAEMMKKKEVAKDIKNEKNSNCDFVDNIENNNVNILENNVVDEKTNVNVNESENNLSTGTNISKNKIVIKKAQKVQPPKRITYYLNQDTIKKIEKYSKLTGMGKSELVQTLLDISLNNLEIE